MRNFIANIDDASIRIHQLETKLGLPHGEFIENIDDANIRIEQLESQLAAAQPTTYAPTATPSPTIVHATGLQRAIAGHQGKKTHIEPPKPLTGLARAIAANTARHHTAD